MTTALSPADSLPRLTRLLEWVARGVRSARSLQEALGVDARTVESHLQAAEWLGLIEPAAEGWLTAQGLEFVYAGERRLETYGRLVWAIPWVQALWTGRPRLPTSAEFAQALAVAEPSANPADLKRRAAALRTLLGPAFRHRPLTGGPTQLMLPFQARTSASAVRFEHHQDPVAQPDLYRALFGELLDHGELGLPQIRAIFDRAGATSAQIGAYVDLALRRGDASRRHERLCLTRAGASRGTLGETTLGIVLSDPGFREWLGVVSQAEAEAKGGQPRGPASVRRDALSRQWRSWQARLDRSLPAGAGLEAALLGRPLAAFPLAAPENNEDEAVEQPFLDAWRGDQPLAIALPPTLDHLDGGVNHLNQSLKSARQQSGSVAMPTIADRPVLYHGGLLHPGEPLPRSIPDVRTLRLRLLMHSPYPAMLAALLWLHRQSPHRVAIARPESRWALVVDGESRGDPLVVLDGFARSRGWVVARRPEGGLPLSTLINKLELIGIVSRMDRQVVLAERLFFQLSREAEEMEVGAQLQPLALALEAHLWA